eukprot:SAG22_NODE_82_length_21749_cov_10.719769_3_plen_495_part_00
MAAPPPASAAAAAFKPDQGVFVYGLRPQTDLNGASGVVLGGVPAAGGDDSAADDRGRVMVRLHPSHTRRQRKNIAARPANLFPDDPAGRQKLFAARAADVLALRGAVAGLPGEPFGGLAEDLALKIAEHLPRPERLYLFSGFHGKVYNNVFQYSHRAGSWVEPASMLGPDGAARSAGPRIDCCCVKLSPSTMLIAGGVDDHPQRGRMQRTAVLFDAVTHRWTELPDMECCRHGCAGALVGNTVYVRQRSCFVKGSDHCLSLCFSAFPCGSTALTEDRCNQVVGGSYVAEHVAPWLACDYESCFDLQTQTWGRIPQPNIPSRVFPAVGAVGGRVVLAGGESSGTGVSKSVEIYDPAARSWQPGPEMQAPRSASGFCEWNGLFVMAGAAGLGRGVRRGRVEKHRPALRPAAGPSADGCERADVLHRRGGRWERVHHPRRAVRQCQRGVGARAGHAGAGGIPCLFRGRAHAAVRLNAVCVCVCVFGNAVCVCCTQYV